MHDDSEALQRKLLNLLQDLLPTASLADAEALSQGWIATGNDRSPAPLNTFPAADPSVLASNHHSPDTVPNSRESLSELGEIPAVQDRFHALLKHRLQTEIQHNPPLFPWETEIHDYEADTTTYLSTAAVSNPMATEQQVPVWVWLNQLRTLNLPVAVPDKVLAQLLQRCQEVAHSTLLEGAKLVQAVEDFFPGQSPALNHLAGLVMTSPARSGGTVGTPTSGTNYPVSYEAAAPAQQMVLSLLAAREILASLTLTLSANQTTLERQWLIDGGTLNLSVTYEPDPAIAGLRIRAHLPTGGNLTLRGNGQQASADRAASGNLSVELVDILPNQPYTAEVRLTGTDPNPLIFTVRIVEA